MPGSGRYGTVTSRLRKKSPLLARSFPHDPQNDGSLTHEKLVEIANRVLLPSVQRGDPVLAPSVNLDFASAPDVTTAVTSTADPNKGWAMTPWTPNVVSPGADPAAVGDVIAVNADPNRQDDPQLTPADVRPSAIVGAGGLVLPSSTAAEIGSLTLDARRETLQFGKRK